eukprot:TRINITY_DN4476_c0_g1_i2.p1 TRINITY_DN4476_c0_g1~~TRINITY_DN4476_c0_g1_i2.p1  ORF type:complete len:277 (+),score=67.86 TRINITY_DN4476_c0_g1_i2:172-1002(+)
MPRNWVRFEHAGAINVGELVHSGTMVAQYSGTDLIDPGTPTGRSFAVDQVKLLAPIEPRSIVALWNNFHERAIQEGQQLPDFPLYFMKPTSSVIGPGDPVWRPLGKNRDDGAPVRVIYEAELGLVIKKECKCVSEEEAADYVLGYTCVNDVTAPKILFEFKSKVPFQQWSRSKGYDSFTPIGPYLTTDVDVSTVRVKAVLDGEVKQDYPVSDMVFSPMKAVSMLSHVQTLVPGDLISLGTSVGSGPMEGGQKIAIQIEGVGTLENVFMDQPPSAKL